MDHSFHTGSSRHYHPGNSHSQQFRISPVNLPGGNRNSSSNNLNSNSSQQQLYNSVSSLFGSPGVHNLFGRPGSSSSYLNSVGAPNHFNFPLRSNSVNNNRASYNGNGNSNGLTGGNSFNRNRGNPSHTQNQNMNKSRQQSHQTSNGVNTSNQPTSPKVAHNNDGGDNQNSIGGNQTQEPQYRIFKRGDTIAGISLPTTVISGGDNDAVSGNIETKFGTHSQTETSGSNNLNDGKQIDKGNSGGDSKDEFNKGSSQPNKTPVSVIRDLARFHGLSVEYRLTEEKGPPHSPIFTVVLHLGPNEEYVGQGSSIKRAQHAAATDALDKTALSKPTARTQPKRPYGLVGKRPNWALLQLTAVAEDLKEPISIVQQPITIMDPFRRGDPPSVVSVHVGERIFTGEGNNFNAAKNMAAMIALKAMLKVKQDLDLKKLADSGLNGENGVSMENKSPISIVHEMAMKRGLNVKFEVVDSSGLPHNKLFTVMCSVGNDECSGQGSTKQAAKKTSCEQMIEKMRELPPPASPQIGSLKSIQKSLLRQKNPRKKSSAPVVKDLEKQSVSPISRLIQIAHIRKYKEPEFNLIASSTNGSMNDDIVSILRPMSERERRNIRKKKPSFTMEVIVGPHSCIGIGPNKKAGKKAAAEAALVELGYGPSEESIKDAVAAANTTGKSKSMIGESSKNPKSDFKSAQNENSLPINLTSARQIVPGIIVLNAGDVKSDHSGNGSPIKTAMAQEMIKVNSMSSTTTGSTSRDGTDKLAYLAKLLNVPVSYSDFPKKNEFLSVVSLGTIPPHVAHGCGVCLEEARNSAALKILEELSDIGLDSIKTTEENSITTPGNKD